MLKIPKRALKAVEIPGDDPLIVEAKKPRKGFEKCWCGSNKKYKNCHRFRGQQKPYTLGKLIKDQRTILWKSRGCMHPKASSEICNGKVIDSHTIQRKGAIAKIVDETNHVLHVVNSRNEPGFEVEKIGWKKASIFPGFCSLHDTQLFGELEQSEFDGSHIQCVLQAFRSVCNELYRKRALLEALEFQRGVVDRGKSLDDQIDLQLSYNKNTEAQNQSLKELQGLWEYFEKVVLESKYNDMESKVYFFEGDLNVVSLGSVQAEFDFEGNKLCDLWNLAEEAETVTHSVMATPKGGAIVFCWKTGDKDPAALVESFDRIPDQHKPDIFIQYCFLSSENTYFSEKWWKSLLPHQQYVVKKLAGTLYYEGGKFEPCSERLIDWTI